MTFTLDDYQTVPERITEFYKAYPKGALRRIGDPVPWEFGGKMFIAYTAGAWRDASTSEPDGMGTAWEPVPGPTQFTRDSELMNAETAAWGRAIVACGAATAKKPVASREEVRNRQGAVDTPSTPSTAPSAPNPEAAAEQSGADGVAVRNQLVAVLLGMDKDDRHAFLEAQGFKELNKRMVLDLPLPKVQALLEAAG